MRFAFLGRGRRVFIAGRGRFFSFIGRTAAARTGGLGSGLRRRLAVLTIFAFQFEQFVTFLQTITEFDLQALHHARLGRWDFHAGFVGLERQDALVGFDAVADLDEQLDYFTLTAADVGYAYGFTHNRFSCAHAASAIQGIALLGVDTELGDGLGHHLAFDGATIGECLERGDGDPATVDFEEVSQLGA